jgi:prepilin-type N-terminal cleavage/methylation domain-containing protein
MNVSGKPKSAGFTLIEVLVVITIIAIIAALSFSMLPKIMRRAKGAEVMQNMRQIAPMFMAYAGDHASKLPPANGPVTLPDGTTQTLQWNVTCLTLLYPDTAVATFSAGNWWRDNKTILKNPLFKTSTALNPGYGFNLKLPQNIATAKGDPAISDAEALTTQIPIAAITEPNRAPLIAPCNVYTYKYEDAATVTSFKTGVLKDLTVDDKIPVLFVDGHSENMTPTEYVNRKLFELPRE